MRGHSVSRRRPGFGDLIRNAEAALNQAKHTGDAAVYYTPTLNADITERLALETRLRRAIEEKQFVLYYQPKINITYGKIIGVEALIRWKEPESGIVPPSRSFRSSKKPE